MIAEFSEIQPTEKRYKLNLELTKSELDILCIITYHRDKVKVIVKEDTMARNADVSLSIAEGRAKEREALAELILQSLHTVLIS